MSEAGWFGLSLKVWEQSIRARSRNRQTASDRGLNMEWVRAAAVLHQAAERELWRAVEVGRRSGLTWGDVGAVLATTAQAAQQRFSKPPRGRLF